MFVFLDGVGLGENSPTNPFAASDTYQPTPFLSELLGGALTLGTSNDQATLMLKPIDASLGMSGLPQSATGQTSLYTGRNAPAFIGRHLTAFANGTLRILIEESGIFKQVLALGGSATLANLYSDEYFQAIEKRRIRYSVGTLLNLTAGLPFRMPEDYFAGKALFWDIIGHLPGQRGLDIPTITPHEAGKRLANIAADYNVTLFESYAPDFAGHSQDFEAAKAVIHILDDFFQALITHLPADVTLVVSSDHGNIEDLSRKTHTLNPVPLLAYGQDAAAFRPIEDIMGITPTILSLLNS